MKHKPRKDTLTRKFQERIKAGILLSRSDDAVELLPDADVFTKIFNAIYVIGCYPWEKDHTPKILFRYPAQPFDEEATLAKICFPYNQSCHPRKISFSSNEFLAKHVIDDTDIISKEFVPLYLPENYEAPYLFCFHFDVTPLTFPTFAHNKSFSELYNTIESHKILKTKICIAFKTKIPYYKMFDLFFEWFMRTELLSRVQIYEIFNYNSKPDFSQCKWAETQRKYSLDVLKKLQGLVFPNQGECIDIQHPVVNVPEFHWKRPDEKDGVLGSFTSIAENSVKYLLAKIVNPKHFISLFFNLFLERTIIVYSNEIDVICWIVLALHFLLRPMRWVSGSISCLPADFEDFMNSPNPLIIGTLFKGSPEPDSVYLNFIKTSFNLPNYFKPPFLKDFVHNINHCWGKENTPTEILKFCNDYVSKMEKAIQVCIMTNFTDPVRVNSVFMKELFLGRFDPSEREFCNALLDTQMFRFHVEQECKKKSDQMIISNVPKNVPEASE